jgi:hypothetical protein
MPFLKVVRYVLLRPLALRPELEVIQNNCRVRFVGISQYVHFNIPILQQLERIFVGSMTSRLTASLQSVTTNDTKV